MFVATFFGKPPSCVAFLFITMSEEEFILNKYRHILYNGFVMIFKQ